MPKRCSRNEVITVFRCIVYLYLLSFSIVYLYLLSFIQSALFEPAVKESKAEVWDDHVVVVGYVV